MPSSYKNDVTERQQEPNDQVTQVVLKKPGSVDERRQ